jgi:hypothetical protein
MAIRLTQAFLFVALFVSGSEACSPVVAGKVGAGFSGIRIAEALPMPARCRTPQTCGDSLLTDSVDLFRNKRYSWRPALSTGVTSTWYWGWARPLGVGLGMHVAFVPDASGKTAPFPTGTISLGTHDGTEVMFGAILSPTDDVRFPNGQGTYRVAQRAGRPAPDFVVPNVKKTANLFLAIRILGIGQTEDRAKEGNEPAASVKVTAAKTTLAVGETEQLAVAVADANGNTMFRSVSFESSSPAIVEVTSGGKVSAKSAGTAIVTVTSGPATGKVTLTVPKPQ